MEAFLTVFVLPEPFLIHLHFVYRFVLIQFSLNWWFVFVSVCVCNCWSLVAADVSGKPTCSAVCGLACSLWCDSTWLISCTAQRQGLDIIYTITLRLAEALMGT